ncbi:MAG TPA: hypothetical protein PLP34_08640 [Chitinophagaceae bacterium]|nr:hypothetical protein [Chitinophagaceae bacterium]HNF72468.1 hypothetical protein [Chitinophagaceae bacterium]
MLKKLILLFICVSLLLSCNKKPVPDDPIPPLTDEQKLANALQSIHGKKFKMNYYHSRYGIWKWDTTLMTPITMDSTVYTSADDTLWVDYTSMQTLEFRFIQKGSGATNTLFSAGTGDTIFFPKLYTNANNEAFIGILCRYYCKSSHVHDLAFHNHNYDTIPASSFHDFTLFDESVNFYYSVSPAIEVQYYFEKDSIAAFHYLYDGSAPVDPSQRRGFIVLYGKGI